MNSELVWFRQESFSQTITGDELLEKVIQYHDPNGNWKTFKGALFVSMQTPKGPNRKSEINIENWNFHVTGVYYLHTFLHFGAGAISFIFMFPIFCTWFFSSELLRRKCLSRHKCYWWRRCP